MNNEELFNINQRMDFLHNKLNELYEALVDDCMVDQRVIVKEMKEELTLMMPSEYEIKQAQRANSKSS